MPGCDIPGRCDEARGFDLSGAVAVGDGVPVVADEPSPIRVRPAHGIRQAGRDPARRRFHPRPRFRLRPPRAPRKKKPLPKSCLAKRSGSSFWRTTLERMNPTTTASSSRKSSVRGSVTGAFHPFSTPRSPQTPSLPDAPPRSARFRCGGRESNFLAVTPWRNGRICAQ